MKIIAFAGSNSSTSINKQLVEYTAKQLQEYYDIEILDLNDYEMPLFSVNREKTDGIPKLALEFAQKIDSANLLLISLAEHNSSYTVAFKNIFDWISRIKDRKHFGDKPVFLMSTSPGMGAGKHVVSAFEARAPHSGATILETFTLPKFQENFDIQKGILEAEKNNEFIAKLNNVKNFLTS